MPEIAPKKQEIASHGFVRFHNSYHAVNYIQDLSECLKSATDQERIKNMMSTINYNRETDENLRRELKGIKAEMLVTTDKLIKMSDYKLWRQNNIAFMSLTDKVISSLPSLKN